MSYFEADFIAFFQELSANNNKEWFHTNKKRFEKSVKQPFENFVQEMIDRLRSKDPSIDIAPKDAVFRIYRDVRFAKDKTPYKTHMAALISPTGRKDPGNPGLYFQMNAEEVRIYGGVYMVEKDALHRLRSYISTHLDEFERLLAGPEFRAKFDELRGEQHKRIPPEFKAAAQKQPLLLNKQFYFFAKLKPKTVLRDDLADTLMDYYLAGKPLSDFLKKGLAAK